MTGPHQGQPLKKAGTSIAEADAAVILVHGRGATADSILELRREFDRGGVAYLAPQARNNEWYPRSFLAPLEENEPGLSSGLKAVGDAVATTTEAGVPLERTLLLGFSQGACLASEWAARNPARMGGIAVLSGGLIGPEVSEDRYSGDLEGTPVFLGCSDRDPHIPAERVHETADVFEGLDADVETRIYEGMGHGVNRDELNYVADMINSL